VPKCEAPGAPHFLAWDGSAMAGVRDCFPTHCAMELRNGWGTEGLCNDTLAARTKSPRGWGRPAFWTGRCGLADFQHAVQGCAGPVFVVVGDLDAVNYAAFDEVLKRPGQVLRADAVHGGAEAAGFVEGEDAFAEGRVLFGQPVDEVNFSADGEGGAFRGFFDEGNEALGGAEGVGFLADLKTALRVDDDLDAGVLGPDLIDVAGQEALVDGAVALPEQDAALGELVLGLAALDGPRVPNLHFLERNLHGVACVAAEVLVGEEEDALCPREGPAEGCRGIGRGADEAAALTAEGLDGGGGVHVGDGDGVGGEAEALERFPAVFDLGNFGHIGHGAAGVEVREDDLLAGVAEDIGALCHEVDAAEDDVLRAGFSGGLGELVAVAGEICEAHDLVALIMVAEENGGRAEGCSGPGDACVHGVIGQREIVFKAAGGWVGREGRVLHVNNRSHLCSAFSCPAKDAVQRGC